MTRTYALRFLDTELRLDVGAGVSVQPILDFFSSHFTFSERGGGCPRVTLNLFRGEAYPPQALGNPMRVWIRQSASEFFSVPAERLRYEGDDCLRATRTGTTLRFRKNRLLVDVGLQEPCPALDLIELIRDLVMKFEQEAGKVAIHAASCLRGGDATLIVGAAGAGKSTLGIDLVKGFGCTLLSGDKTLLWCDGQDLMCAGWPDWPHIGLGTASKYPELVNEFALSELIASVDPGSLWATVHKLALDPVRFRQIIASAPCGTIARVGRIIYPQIEPASGTDVSKVSDPYAGLADHIETAFRPGGDWHEMVLAQRDVRRSLAAIIASVRPVPAFKLRGVGVLNAEHGAELGLQ